MAIRAFKQRWQTAALNAYQSLAEREQRLLMFTVIFVPMMVIIFGLFLPLQDKLHAKQASLRAMQHDAQEAERLAQLIRQQGVKKEHGNIMTVVDQEARKQHVRAFITSMRPQLGGEHPRLWLQMHQAPYLASVQFYQALAKQGVNIVQSKWQKTPQAGIVNIQAVVQ